MFCLMGELFHFSHKCSTCSVLMWEVVVDVKIDIVLFFLQSIIYVNVMAIFPLCDSHVLLFLHGIYGYIYFLTGHRHKH